jgi:hypothetical protein
MNRKYFCPFLLTVTAVLLPTSIAYGQPNQSQAQFKDRYTTYKLQGYCVHVGKDVAQLGKEKVSSALEVLDDRLACALAVIPKDRRMKLDIIRFWIEQESSGVVFVGGQQVRAAAGYVPILHKMVGTGHEKEGGIEIGAKCCLLDKDDVVGKINPYWILHELAHAYHDRVLELEYRFVKDAYKSAMLKRLYDEVEMKTAGSNGKIEIHKGAAYARTNHLEYFAELSVAYLARNWAYPYTAEDLRKHDPEGFKLMESVWGEKPKQK